MEKTDYLKSCETVLKEYAHDFCEGWCLGHGGYFDDCSGCSARHVLDKMVPFKKGDYK